MAYKYEKETGDIVISSWESGIAQSPELGFSDMRCVNLVSFPKEVCVGFSTTQTSPIKVAGGSALSSSGNVITWSNTATLTNGMAVKFSAATIGNIVVGTVYWVGSVSGATFSLYTDPLLASIFALGSSGTGTFSTINMQEPRYYTNQPSYSAPSQISFTYLIDTAGAVWATGSGFGSSWTFLGNDLTQTGSNGNGIVFYQAKDGAGYLFTFRNNKIDYLKVAATGGSPTAYAIGSWAYGWQTLNTGAGNNLPHEALWSFQDNFIYYTDSAFVGSFAENTAAGSTFDPTNASTYTFNQKALYLPQNDSATCLTILGNNLLIGGVRNLIYPWNRQPVVLTGSLIYGYQLPIFLSESYIAKLVTVNTNVYIFAGFRGRVYVSNGTYAQLFTKVPDSIGQTPDPIYTWKTAGSFRNQIYFGFTYVASANTQPNNPLYGGVWAVDITNAANQLTFPTAEALRITQQLSFGTYSGYASLIIIGSDNASGGGFNIGWSDGTGSTFGVDNVGSATYSNYQTYIDTDIIPVGTFLKPKTPAQIEFKLNSGLGTGEGVKILAKTSLTSSNSTQSFVQVGETTTSGAISDVYTSNFQNAQWIQLRIALKSPGNASGDSFVRLTEVRIR